MATIMTEHAMTQANKRSIAGHQKSGYWIRLFETGSRMNRKQLRRQNIPLTPRYPEQKLFAVQNRDLIFIASKNNKDIHIITCIKKRKLKRGKKNKRFSYGSGKHPQAKMKAKRKNKKRIKYYDANWRS